jgi:hypothetical protein
MRPSPIRGVPKVFPERPWTVPPASQVQPLRLGDRDEINAALSQAGGFRSRPSSAGPWARRQSRPPWQAHAAATSQHAARRARGSPTAPSRARALDQRQRWQPSLELVEAGELVNRELLRQSRAGSRGAAACSSSARWSANSGGVASGGFAALLEEFRVLGFELCPGRTEQRIAGLHAKAPAVYAVPVFAVNVPTSC